MNAHEFRQNWTSVSITVDFCMSCKDYPKGNGQQCFLSHAPHILSLQAHQAWSQRGMGMLLAAPNSVVDSAKRNLSSKHRKH